MSAQRMVWSSFWISVGLSLSILWASGCGSDPSAPREFWRPWYELPAQDLSPVIAPDLGVIGAIDLALVSDAKMMDADLPKGCGLSISVTTTSTGGKYAPRNIGAIWIADASQRFIKSLYVWAGQRAKYLKRWNDATSAAMMPGSRVDAISSATQSAHGVRTATWSCTDTAGKRVADGTYQVCFELTDYDGQGPHECVSFVKGSAPFVLTPMDGPSFTRRRLEFLP